MEKLGDHPLPWNQHQALDLNLFPGPQRLSAPSPYLQKSHPCAQHPEADVTLTTSGSLHRLLCIGMWANTRPQKAWAPALQFQKEPPEAVTQPGSATSPGPPWPSSISHLYILRAHLSLA